MKTDTPITNKYRGFHDLETAVPAEKMEELERENTRLRIGLKSIADWNGGMGVKWPMEIAADILSNKKVNYEHKKKNTVAEELKA